MSAPLPAGARLWGASRFVPQDERVVRAFRPSLWFVCFHAGRWLAVCGVALAFGIAWARFGPGQHDLGGVVARIGAFGLVVYVAIGLLRWWSRLYVITEKRVVIVAGVLSQAAADLPLARVQHVIVSKSLIERVLGIGTVGIATAGSDGPAIRMLMVARAPAIVELLRSTGRDRRHEGIAVIGLAGGIGAGKSEVARAFASLGCVVVDSDAEARTALDRADVKDRLVEWWGSGVLGEDGRIDRGRVAHIVFGSSQERERLEALVHPIVRSSRCDLIAKARRAGARAAVIDAPLLFEAGVDAECDAVVWVEASRRTRLERVARTRNWDEAELERREKAQWPIERKRSMCRYEVLNESDGSVRDRVEAVLARVLADLDSGAIRSEASQPA